MGWEKVTLSEVAFYRSEKIKFDEVLIDNYISTENMIADKGGIECSSSLPKSGSSNVYYKSDILVSNIRPYFKKIWFADKMGACSNDVLVFALKNDRIDATYLYYYLSTDNFFDYIMSGSNGVKMPRGNKKSIMDYRLLLPPLKTQQKIASLLSNYDKLIENNTQRIKALESMVEELYKEWFVRLRFPGYEDVEVMDGVPEGWERVRLGNTDIQFIDGDRGKNYPNQHEFFDSEYCLFLNTGNITKTGFDFAKVQFITKEKDDILRKGKVEVNDIIITTRGTIGNIGLASKEIKYKNMRINSGMVIIRISTKKLNPIYLHQYFVSKHCQNDIKLFTTGAAQPQLPISTLKKIYILVPSNNILNKFTELIETNYNLSEIIKNKNQTLKQTRDLLLPRLMSGKLNVEDLDII